MAGKFLLTCECGAQHPISERNAGETIPCECGKTLDVPTLREIRHLPQAPDDTPPPPAPKGWSFLHGVFFAISVPVLLGSLVLVGRSLYLIQQLPEIDITVQDVLRHHPDPLLRVDVNQLKPSQALQYWKPLQETKVLSRATEPPNVTVRKRRIELNRHVRNAAIAATLGLLIVVGAIATSSLRK